MLTRSCTLHTSLLVFRLQRKHGGGGESMTSAPSGRARRTDNIQAKGASGFAHRACCLRLTRAYRGMQGLLLVVNLKKR
jgi:hypothetical protein